MMVKGDKFALKGARKEAGNETDLSSAMCLRSYFSRKVCVKH